MYFAPDSAVIAPETGLRFIAGGDGVQISVDDLAGLLNMNQTIRAECALHRDRKRRKEKLRGK